MPNPQTVRSAIHDGFLDDDGHDQAEHVVYDPTASGLTATDVQAAIDELAGGTGGGPVAAEDVTVTDAGGFFTGTDVEAVLQEIGAGVVSAAVVYAPIMVDNPNVITTTGETVWLPWTTDDGVPILMEVAP